MKPVTDGELKETLKNARWVKSCNISPILSRQQAVIILALKRWLVERRWTWAVKRKATQRNRR